MNSIIFQVALWILYTLGHSSSEEIKRALLIVDVQKCFVQGGNLAVPNGDDVVPVINEIRMKFESKFDSVYLSQDFHPARHVSFASQYVDKRPFDLVNLHYDDRGHLCKPTQLKDERDLAVDCDQPSLALVQQLWPDHCVIGTDEVNLVDNIITNHSKDVIITKGTNPAIDSYSAFFDNGKIAGTGLHEALQKDGIKDLFVVGLATDFCVKFTALDGASLGYKVYLIENATKGITEAGVHEALVEMSAAGIQVINTEQLENIFSDT